MPGDDVHVDAQASQAVQGSGEQQHSTQAPVHEQGNGQLQGQMGIDDSADVYRELEIEDEGNQRYRQERNDEAATRSERDRVAHHLSILPLLHVSSDTAVQDGVTAVVHALYNLQRETEQRFRFHLIQEEMVHNAGEQRSGGSQRSRHRESRVKYRILLSPTVSLEQEAGENAELIVEALVGFHKKARRLPRFHPRNGSTRPPVRHRGVSRNPDQQTNTEEQHRQPQQQQNHQHQGPHDELHQPKLQQEQQQKQVQPRYERFGVLRFNEWMCSC